MPITPEDRARNNIDKLLTEAGWIVQDKKATNLSAGRGVAVREFPLKSGHGEADYLLFVDSAPIGVVEAKKEGDTLTGDCCAYRPASFTHKALRLMSYSSIESQPSKLHGRKRCGFTTSAPMHTSRSR